MGRLLALALLLGLLGTLPAWAQPANLGTNLPNGNYTNTALQTVGGFRQARIQATATLSSGVSQCQFSLGPTDYSKNWRCYDNVSNATLRGYNTVIDPNTEEASARYNTGNGKPAYLPAVTSGSWYTFNITANASASNYMAVLVTAAQPTSINSISPSGTANMVAYGNGYPVNVTLGSSPGADEKFWIRYTTNGFSSSQLAPMTVSGTTASGTIPNQTSGGSSPTVQYYVLSSPAASALATGSTTGTASDMQTLNLSGVGSFTYTQATFSSVTQNPAAGAVPYNGAVNVTATLNTTPGAGEYVYLRYSTASNFATSTTVAMSVSGTSATATIPALATVAAPKPTIYYYVLTSYSSTAAGTGNPDGVTLQRGNNGGSNYSYSYKFTTISGTTRTPSTVSYGDGVTVTSTLSGTPYATEYFYLRYSTVSDFSTSTIVAMTVSGTSISGSIPGMPSGTVYYYVFSSPGGSGIAGSYSGGAGNYATISIDNNSGGNYTYVVGPMNGTYTVNQSLNNPRNFVTMTSAVNAVSVSGVSGPVTFNVKDGQTFNESNLNVISPAGTSATNTITFQRDATGSARPLVQPPSTAAPGRQDAVIKLQGADYVTFDGIDVGEYPSISATNLAAGNNPAMEYGYAMFRNSATDGCQYNTVKNSTITLNRTNGNPTYGVYLAPTDISGTSVSASSVPGTNSYNNVLGCAVVSAQNGLVAAGSGSNDQNNVLGNIVGAQLGNNISNCTSFGILVYNQTNITIGSNLITFPTGNTGNQYGIVVGGNTPGTIVARNRVFTIKYSGTGGKGVRGISLDPGSGTFNMVIRNNAVGNLTADGNGASTDSQIMGIGVLSGAGYNIYNNSVQLNGDRATNGFAGKIAAALYVGSGASGLDVRNNVLSNVQTTSDTGQPGTDYGVYAAGTTNPFTAIDYNLHDVRSGATLRTTAASPEFLGHLSGVDYTTLASWQTATGQSRSSQYSDGSGPNGLGFTSPTNFMPDPSDPSVWVLNGMGVQIASVAADLPGTNRPTTVAAGAPDLGAYEVNPTSTPNPLVVSNPPTLGGTQTFTLNGRLIATIVYGSTGTVPSSVTGRYYSGTNPPTPFLPGAKTQNDYFAFVNDNNDGSNYTYTLQTFYDPASLGGIGSESAQRLQQLNADNSGYTAVATTVNTAARTLTSPATLQRISIFAVSDVAAPLPVTLVSFEAKRQGSNALLTWATASELNSAGFEVQVSATGQPGSFQVLGFIASAGGNARSMQSYVYVDQQAGKSSLRYYRLRQVDLDGKNNFSDVRSVQFDNPTTAAFTVYPSPFRGDNLTVALTLPQAVSTASLTLTDALGRQVLRQSLGALPAGFSQPALPGLTGLPAGLYVLRLALPTGIQTVKVVKE